MAKAKKNTELSLEEQSTAAGGSLTDIWASTQGGSKYDVAEDTGAPKATGKLFGDELVVEDVDEFDGQGTTQSSPAKKKGWAKVNKVLKQHHNIDLDNTRKKRMLAESMEWKSCSRRPFRRSTRGLRRFQLETHVEVQGMVPSWDGIRARKRISICSILTCRSSTISRHKPSIRTKSEK